MIPIVQYALAIVLAVATPQPVLHGVASWYTYHPGQAAAGSELRTFLGPKWRGQTISVCASTCIQVTLTDWCGCPGTRIIDLDRRDFARLAPISRGLVDVTVR